MNSILENLFYEWSEPYDLRDALLPNLNGYRDARGEWEAAGAALEAALGEEEKRLLERYADAALAYYTVGERAALAAGAGTALRLLLAVLTP